MRKLPIPVLSKAAKENLHVEGMKLRRHSVNARERIDTIVFQALHEGAPNTDPKELATVMADRAGGLRRMRQRIAA